MDLIDQSGLDIAGAMFALIVAGVVHVIIVRRLTTTLFDPVFYVALAGVFSIATTHTLASLGVEIYVWLAFAAFWFGVLMVSPKLGVPCAAISVSPTSAD